MASAVLIDVTQVERLASRLLTVDTESIGQAAMRSVNIVGKRGFDTSRKLMLRGVNLTESYVSERMDFEPANDPKKPTAVIVAFRPGGERKPGTKPVNLRQFVPIVAREPNNWSNSGVAADSGRAVFVRGTGATPHRKAGTGPNPQGTQMYRNPRKPGSYLPFIPRTGNPAQGIPVGQKQASISVEVVRGSRKTIKPSREGFNAFMQRMPNGQVLVMRRTTKNGGKNNKGKIEALHSLSVWQLFRNTTAKVIPLIADDLQSTVADEVIGMIEKQL